MFKAALINAVKSVFIHLNSNSVLRWAACFEVHYNFGLNLLRNFNRYTVNDITVFTRNSTPEMSFIKIRIRSDAQSICFCTLEGKFVWCGWVVTYVAPHISSCASPYFHLPLIACGIVGSNRYSSFFAFHNFCLSELMWKWRWFICNNVICPNIILTCGFILKNCRLTVVVVQATYCVLGNRISSVHIKV